MLAGAVGALSSRHPQEEKSSEHARVQAGVIRHLYLRGVAEHAARVCVTVRVNSIGRSGQKPAAPMCERVISSRYGAKVERRCHGFCQGTVHATQELSGTFCLPKALDVGQRFCSDAAGRAFVRART